MNIAARGRVLVVHTNDSYEEWGAAASVHMQSSDNSGLSMSVLPEWGGGHGGVGALWSGAQFGGVPKAPAVESGNGTPTWAPTRVRAEIGYSVPVVVGRFEPFGRWNGQTGVAHSLDAGARLSTPWLDVALYAQQDASGLELGRRVGLEGRVALW